MAVVHNYLPGEPLLIEKIVYELKSQGIFDQFRKECIADVDTKPAYQNLRQRVEGSVSGFLSKQKWSSDMNKNQLREMLRKNIYESGFLETGVERIVDQVVNPKMNSVFLPKVTEVVYKFLGIEKQTNEKKENLKLTFSDDNLLPTDLEAVSPESEKKFDIDDNQHQNLDDSKIDEDESPPFEPLEEKPIYIPPEENSVDSHLSGISGLMSHDSNHSQEFSKPIQMDISNQDSMLSKQSSEGRLSIVMSDDNETKMEICEDSLQKTPKTNETKPKEFEFSPEILTNNNATPSSSTKKTESKSEDKSKGNEKSSKSHEKHKSRRGSSRSDKKDDRNKRNDKDRKEHKHSSSRDKEKDKDRKDSKSSSSKSEKEKSDKSDKDRSKSSSSSSNRHSSSKDKDKNSNSSSSSKKDSTSSSSKDRGDYKDKSKSNSSSSSSKDKDSKHKDTSKSKSDSKSSSKHDSSSKSDKHKKDDKHRSDRHSSSSKTRDKDKKDSKKDKKESTKDDHFSSKKKPDRRSTDRDSNDGQSGLKSSSSSFDSSSASSQTQNKSQESSNSNSNSNNGSGDSGNSDAVEECMVSNTPVTILNDKLEELEEVAINSVKEHIQIPPALKLIKPKFASNIHEAKRLMKIRKQLALLEKQNYLDVSRMLEKKKKIEDKSKTVNAEDKTKNKLKKNKINNHNVVHNNHSVKQKKEPIPKPLSPPLKSSVVSAATWDALEAKLHQSLNYSTCYDVVDAPEEITVSSVSHNKDDCLFLEPDSSERTKRYMKHATESIKALQEMIDSQISGGDKKARTQKTTSNLCNQVNNVISRGVKRKFSDYQSDVKNNNKKFNTHHIEVHENFSLPLSPAESDNSIDKKSDTSESSYKSLKKAETEFTDKAKKSVRAAVAKTQRYSSEDLYKPRPVFGGSRRRNGRNLGVD